MSFIKAEKPHLLEEVVYFDSGFTLKLFMFSKHLQINTSRLLEPRPGAQHTLKWLGPCEIPMAPPADAPNRPKYQRERGEFQQHSCDKLEKGNPYISSWKHRIKGKKTENKDSLLGVLAVGLLCNICQTGWDWWLHQARHRALWAAKTTESHGYLEDTRPPSNPRPGARQDSFPHLIR